MSTTVKTGWLHDKNGDKFAPKTLTSQVQTNDGILIEDKIQTDLESVKTYINTKLSELPDPVVNPDVASVGQTLVVKEVDENGKPAKWESADYQPRTHWEEEVEILPETTAEFDAETGVFNIPIIPNFSLIHGQEYIVVYNGSEYSCQAMYMEDAGHKGYILGNYLAFEGTGDTGHPFLISIDTDLLLGVCAPLDGSTSVTLSIKGSKPVTIPTKYVPSLEEMRTSVTVILPETTVEIDPEQGFGVIPHDFTLEEGKEYTVRYNGVDYIVSNGIQMEGVFIMGNMGATEEGLPVTNDPFIIVSEEGENVDGSGFIRVWMVMPLDGSTSVTLSIKGSKTVTISPKYLPDGIGYEEDVYILPKTTLIDTGDGLTTTISQPIVVGETYKITYNGSEYSCEARDSLAVMGEPGAVILGNIDLGMGTGDTGEPFVAVYEQDEQTLVFEDVNGVDIITVSISQSQVRTIPYKYMPSSVPFDESVELVPETIPTIVEDGNGVLFIASDVKFIPNETYEIMYAGTKYMCTAFNVEDAGAVAVGNLALIGMEDTGEPFLMATSPTDIGIMVFPIGSVAMPTVSIAKVKFQKISARCLPEGVGYEDVKVILPKSSPVLEGQTLFLYCARYLELGETYTVTFNNDEYKCTTKLYGNTEMMILGNSSILFGTNKENTGEPFLIIQIENDIGKPVASLFLDSNLNLTELPTVSITKNTVHKIPAKYLPDELTTKIDGKADKTYVDTAVAQRTQVQFITWEDDD